MRWCAKWYNLVTVSSTRWGLYIIWLKLVPLVTNTYIQTFVYQQCVVIYFPFSIFFYGSSFIFIQDNISEIIFGVEFLLRMFSFEKYIVLVLWINVVHSKMESFYSALKRKIIMILLYENLHCSKKKSLSLLFNSLFKASIEVNWIIDCKRCS